MRAPLPAGLVLAFIAGLVPATLSGCNPDDPCARYDTELCVKQDGCEVFVATEMGNVGGNWCNLPSALTEGQVCTTAAPTDCDVGVNYASPPDADGNASDECYKYTGCSAPQGWVDCDPGVGLTIIECEQ